MMTLLFQMVMVYYDGQLEISMKDNFKMEDIMVILIKKKYR